jgi:hypothetical protein
MQREDMILTSTLEVTEDLYRSFQHHHPLHPSSSAAAAVTKSTISKSSPGFSLNHHQPSTTSHSPQPRENEEEDDDNADDRSFDRFLQYSSTNGSNGRFGNDDLLEDTGFVFKGNYHGSENKVKRDHMDEKMNNYLNLILSHVQASHYRKCFLFIYSIYFFLKLSQPSFCDFFFFTARPPFHVICLCEPKMYI